jgi:predicted 2-oxoglutarate/Fe(II)-dependent dioxygenase YbiX
MPAHDRVARTLRGDVRAAFSAKLAAKTDDLLLAVDGLGPVAFPVRPSVARKLIDLAQPARFGRGKETLTDPYVRNTWEIPKHLVRAVWNDGALEVILKTAKDELGLPSAAELTADLHSLLVYEPHQFFLAHQDSEKDDLMIGTLVATLPSTYTGGELVVRHNEERTTHRGSKAELSLVAFYADCRHEVAEVRTGYRIALTYNLLLHRDNSQPEGDEATVIELASLLREHFSTPAPSYRRSPVANLPKRLVYLLDHEYTPRALGWTGMKGADTGRVTLLRAAAERAGCEAVLAVADVKTTHSAYEADEGRAYRRRRYWDDDDDEDSGGSGDDGLEYNVEELIDSEVTLTHWTGPEGTRLENTSLFVGRDEVCTSTGTDDLKPYSSEYEGYMGNWGNTLDRWYHRAAVVVWPREQGFANRAETSPGWALDELAAMASGGELAGARAAAATLQPFWESSLRTPTPEAKESISGLFGKALRTADAVADAATATMLLHPFRVENLTTGHVDAFGRLVSGYGAQWTTELLRTWFGAGQPAWAYTGGQERQRWVADLLPGLCVGLHTEHGAGGAMAALGILDLVWEWISRDIGTALASSRPSYHDKALGELARPLASVLAAAVAMKAASTRDGVSAYLRRQGDAVTALEMPALRAAADLPDDSTRRDAGFGDLAADCAARLRARLARPQRTSADWSIELAGGGCACDLCDTLRGFLGDPNRRTFEWPLAEQRRKHVHSRIDGAELPVSHITTRKGRPYTLVLRKTDALFTDEAEARARDQADLEWLAAAWNLGA